MFMQMALINAVITFLSFNLKQTALSPKIFLEGSLNKYKTVVNILKILLFVSTTFVQNRHIRNPSLTD